MGYLRRNIPAGPTGENRIIADEFNSYKSRQDLRNSATMGGASGANVKDYRASSFQLNIIQEEDTQPNAAVTASLKNDKLTSGGQSIDK